MEEAKEIKRVVIVYITFRPYLFTLALIARVLERLQHINCKFSKIECCESPWGSAVHT